MTSQPQPQPQPLTPEQSRLAESCYRLAFKIGLTIGRRAKATPDQIEDLQAAALMGVVRAARTYDPARGFAFTTYAGQGAQHHALNELRRQRRQARRFPSASEWGEAHNNGPLDLLADHRGAEAAPRSDLESDRLKGLFAELARRSPRQAEAVRRHAAGETHQDIARSWGLTRARVQQVHAKGLAFLRDATPPGLDPASAA